MDLPRRSLERRVQRDAVAIDAPDETMPHPSECEFCAGADPQANVQMQKVVGAGRTRIVAESPRFYVTPTLGAFVRGYVLVVPRAHVHSFGQLEAAPLAEAQAVIDVMTARLARTYGMPVLGFEYGHADGGRRIPHAHWHLLPSEADLHGWLDDRFDGREIDSLTELLGGQQSYVTVRDQDGKMTVYPCEPTDPAARVRLRRAVAELDPRVLTEHWDWAAHPYPELARQTAEDLAPPVAPARRRTPTGTLIPPPRRPAD